MVALGLDASPCSKNSILLLNYKTDAMIVNRMIHFYHMI